MRLDWNLFPKCIVMLDIPDETRNHRRVPYLRLDDIDGVIEADSQLQPALLICCVSAIFVFNELKSQITRALGHSIPL